MFFHMENDPRYIKPHTDWARQRISDFDTDISEVLNSRTKAGHIHFVNALLQQMTLREDRQTTLLKLAIKAKQFHLLPMFAKHRFDPDLYQKQDALLGRHANAWEIGLQSAAEMGDLETVKHLIKQKSVTDIDAINWATDYASKEGHKDVLEFLFDQGAEPEKITMFNSETFKYVMFQVRLNKIESLIKDDSFLDGQTLEDLRKPVENYNCNSIMTAARCGHFRKVVAIALNEKNDRLTIDDLTSPDTSGISVLNYLGRTNQLAHLFVPALWQNRIEDAKALYQEIPPVFQEQVSLSNLINLIQIKNTPACKPPRRRKPGF